MIKTEKKYNGKMSGMFKDHSDYRDQILHTGSSDYTLEDQTPNIDKGCKLVFQPCDFSTVPWANVF